MEPLIIFILTMLQIWVIGPRLRKRNTKAWDMALNASGIICFLATGACLAHWLAGLADTQ